MAVETVTVQMKRSDSNTNWGFRVQGGKEHGQRLTIGRVIEGGLADRAGLKEGDHVIQISGRNVEYSAHSDAQQYIFNSGNNLTLVVNRNVSTIWSPSFPIDDKSIPASVLDQSCGNAHSSLSKDYSKKTTSYSSTSTTGGGGAAQPFYQPSPKPFSGSCPSTAPFSSPTQRPAGPPPTSASLGPGGTSPGGSSYNKYTKQSYYKSTTSSSTADGAAGRGPGPGPERPRSLSPLPPPAPVRSCVGGGSGGGFSPVRPRSPAAAYLEKTGGLFGTDPNLQITPKDEPSYMKSATLKLIQEEKTQSSPAPYSPAQRITEPIVAQDPSGLPVCENCGQRILGVFCKAGGKTLHGECFKCSTCGTSLKNIGYFAINDKLYCDLHAKQQKTNQFRATAPVDPNIFATYGAPSMRSPRNTDPVKAFYQPDVLKPPGEIKSFSPRGYRQQHDSSYSKSTSFKSSSNERTDANGVPNGGAPRSFSPAPFGQQQRYESTKTQKDCRMTTAAGDGIQLFGPKTPNRGRGILKQLQEGPRIPICQACNKDIRGPFVLAMEKSWCPEHFVCATSSCRRQLIEIGFIEKNGSIYCEYCYEKFYAPTCSKCQKSIIGDCLTAMQRQWHPQCFTCVQCHKPFGNASFFLENGQPYCENDWNAQFTTKCNSCQFPIEAGDRWVEALGHSYHSDCFCCTVCQKTLEGQNFYAKGGRPYCKAHA